MRGSATQTDWFVVGALAIALFACKGLSEKKSGRGSDDDSRAAPASAPLVLSWEQPYKLGTGTEAGATFFATKDANKPILKLEASFHDFSKGTKVKVGDTETIVSDSGYWSTLLDIKPAIVAAALEDLKGPVEVGIELSLEPPGAPVAKTRLPKQDLKDSLRFALSKARDGGLTFGAGDVAAPKVRSVAVIGGYSDLEFIGSGKGVTDIDRVVLAENQKDPRTTVTCTFKEGTSTLKVFDASVVVFDRRTGSKVKDHVLQASPRCPMFAFVDKTDNSTKSTVMMKDVVAWARGELARTR